jgi:TolA-binding protein
MIDSLQEQIEDISMKISELREFQSYGGDISQEEELIRLRELSIKNKEYHEMEIQKIKRRHESSVEATAKRVERILHEMEEGANKVKTKHSSQVNSFHNHLKLARN